MCRSLLARAPSSSTHHADTCFSREPGAEPGTRVSISRCGLRSSKRRRGSAEHPLILFHVVCRAVARTGIINTPRSTVPSTVHASGAAQARSTDHATGPARHPRPATPRAKHEIARARVDPLAAAHAFVLSTQTTLGPSDLCRERVKRACCASLRSGSAPRCRAFTSEPLRGEPSEPFAEASHFVRLRAYGLHAAAVAVAAGEKQERDQACCDDGCDESTVKPVSTAQSRHRRWRWRRW